METDIVCVSTLYASEHSNEPDGKVPGMIGLLSSINLDIIEVFKN